MDEGTRPLRRRSVSVPACLAIVTALAGGLTMPRFFYPGDNFTARSEAIRLVQRGQLGAEYSDPAVPRNGARGEFLIENDAKQLRYSKYGIGYTLLYVPPVLVERALRGAELEPYDTGGSLLLVLNVYGLLFTIGTVLYLYGIASWFEPSRAIAAGFALVAVGTSFVWHYLRAPALEVFQIFFFVAFCFHGLRFLRAGGVPAWTRAAKADLALATAHAGVLLLLRPTFGILLPVLGAFALASARAGASAPGGEAIGWRERAVAIAGALVLPAAAFVAVWLAINHVKTGSALDAGYGQWVREDGLPANRFALEMVPLSLRAFFASAGNWNVFLHVPALALSLPLWPSFLSRHRREGLFLLAVGLTGIAIIVPVVGWHGEWCYGPRYLVHPLLVLSIPAVGAWRALASLGPVLRWGGAAAIAALLSVALWMQVEMNSVHYFALHYAVGDLVGEEERVLPTMAALGYRPPVVRELKRFVRGGEPFALMDDAFALLPPPERARARDELRRALRKRITPNWYAARLLGASGRATRAAPAAGAPGR